MVIVPLTSRENRLLIIISFSVLGQMDNHLLKLHTQGREARLEFLSGVVARDGIEPPTPAFSGPRAYGRASLDERGWSF